MGCSGSKQHDAGVRSNPSVPPFLSTDATATTQSPSSFKDKSDASVATLSIPAPIKTTSLSPRTSTGSTPVENSKTVPTPKAILTMSSTAATKGKGMGNVSFYGDADVVIDPIAGFLIKIKKLPPITSAGPSVVDENSEAPVPQAITAPAPAPASRGSMIQKSHTIQQDIVLASRGGAVGSAILENSLHANAGSGGGEVGGAEAITASAGANRGAMRKSKTVQEEIKLKKDELQLRKAVAAGNLVAVLEESPSGDRDDDSAELSDGSILTGNDMKREGNEGIEIPSDSRGVGSELEEGGPRPGSSPALDDHDKCFINLMHHGSILTFVSMDAKPVLDKKGRSVPAYSAIIPTDLFVDCKDDVTLKIEVCLRIIRHLNAEYAARLDAASMRFVRSKQGFIEPPVQNPASSVPASSLASANAATA